MTAHVGCTALALKPWRAKDADDAAASPVVVEMLPAATATPVDSPDVARGPLIEEAMLTPRHGATFDLELPIQFRIR